MGTAMVGKSTRLLMLLKERCRPILQILHILQLIQVQQIEIDLLRNDLILTIIVLVLLLKPLLLGLERSDRHRGVFFDEHWLLLLVQRSGDCCFTFVDGGAAIVDVVVLLFVAV